MIRSVAVVCLVALALPLHQRFAEAGPASVEKQAQRNTCHDMVKKTPDKNPAGLSHPCPLLNQLHYYATCSCTSGPSGGYGVSPADKQLILDFIAEIEVILEGYGDDINDTCVVEVGLRLEVFLEAHLSISNAISYLSLNDSSGVFWGTCRDIVNVKIEIQFEVVGPVIQPDSEGHCPMTDSITEAAEASGDQKVIDECRNLTEAIRKMLKVSGYNMTEQLSFIYQLIVQECSVETIVYLKKNCVCGPFGSFVAVFQVCQINWRVQQMAIYLEGSSSTDCDLLIDLEVSRAATCVDGPNVTQCAQLTDLINQLKVVISSSVSIEVRLQQCSYRIFQYCKLAPWICNIDLGRGGCKLSDIVYTSAFCHNEDVCDCNGPPPPLPCQESGECSGSGSGSGETVTPPECDGSGPCGSGSGETVTPPECDGSGPCGSGSGETVTPPECDGSGPCASGSGETGTPPSCDGSGPCDSDSGETATPPSCDGSGPCASGETVTPPECDGSGPCASGSGETATPPECDGSGPCASGETSPAPGSAETTVAEGSTAAPSTAAPTTAAATTTAAPTTPASPCDSRADLITINTSCNCTAFLVSITEVTSKWTIGEKGSIANTLNMLVQIIYGSGDIASKLAAIKTQLDNVQVTIRAKFQAIVIYKLGSDYKTDKTKKWGSVGEWGSCPSA